MHSVTLQDATRCNNLLPLVDYLIPMVGDKKAVKILDVGSGPFPKTGQLLNGVNIELTHCDHKNFTDFWQEFGAEPLFPIEYQDMEKLTYPNESFDIVHCVNALDHTVNAETALKEMLRVVKVDGWVYIHCVEDQLTTQRKKHYWDAKPDGTFVNLTQKFDLKDYGFSVKYIDIERPARKGEYGQIIGILSPKR